MSERRRLLMQPADDGKVWLYKDGNQYTSLTGGWYYTHRSYNNSYASFDTSEMTIHFIYRTGNTDIFLAINNAIDITRFDKIGIEYESDIVSDQGGIGIYMVIGKISSPTYSSVPTASQFVNLPVASYHKQTFTFKPLVREATSLYIDVFAWTGQNCGTYLKIKKVWLE